MTILLPVLAFLTGLLVPAQLALNGMLGQALKSVWLGAFFVFLTGLLAVGAMLAATQTPLPDRSSLASVPIIAWGGGFLAALYILAVVALVPRLGVGSTAILIIAGQIVGALLIDHLGLFGSTISPISPVRALGATAVLAGATLVRIG